MRNRRLKWKNMGVVSYDHALKLQNEISLSLDENEVVVLCMQHPKVVTLGKNASEDDLLLSMEEYSNQDIQIAQSDRGGKVTAHGPGQLVIWPLLRLSPFEGVKEWVSLLEQIVMTTLSKWQIEAHLDPEHPGVWVGKNKICAVGLRIKNKVSTHGIALNITNSLDIFSTIVPCGLKSRGTTTMSHEAQQKVDVDMVAEEICNSFQRLFAQSAGQSKRQSNVCLAQ